MDKAQKCSKRPQKPSPIPSQICLCGGGREWGGGEGTS